MPSTTTSHSKIIRTRSNICRVIMIANIWEAITAPNPLMLSFNWRLSIQILLYMILWSFIVGSLVLIWSRSWWSLDLVIKALFFWSKTCCLLCWFLFVFKSWAFVSFVLVHYRHCNKIIQLIYLYINSLLHYSPYPIHPYKDPIAFGV